MKTLEHEEIPMRRGITATKCNKKSSVDRRYVDLVLKGIAKALAIRPKGPTVPVGHTALKSTACHAGAGSDFSPDYAPSR